MKEILTPPNQPSNQLNTLGTLIPMIPIQFVDELLTNNILTDEFNQIITVKEAQQIEIGERTASIRVSIDNNNLGDKVLTPGDDNLNLYTGTRLPTYSRVFGMAGNDTLVTNSDTFGGKGNDKITNFGGDGNEINGNQGNDELTGTFGTIYRGGKDLDTFYLNFLLGDNSNSAASKVAQLGVAIVADYTIGESIVLDKSQKLFQAGNDTHVKVGDITVCVVQNTLLSNITSKFA